VQLEKHQMESLEVILSHESVIVGIAISMLLLLILVPLISKIRDNRLLKTVTSLSRGTKSERDLVLRLLKKGIPAITIYHDLYIEKTNGKHAQIDVVVATTEGIIVFEVKDFSGWIFGNGYYPHWTKVLAYGKRKYRFYNPIMQNKNHIASIKKQLRQFNNIPFFSIIVFYGDCELKEINYVPNGTFIVKSHRVFEVLNQIRKNNKPAPYADKHEIIRLFAQAVEQGNSNDIQEEHVEDIKDLTGMHRVYN